MNLETGIVALIVLAFALRAVRQLFPASWRRIVARLRAALRLKPTVLPAAGASCGSGCGSCGSCDTPAPRQIEQPLRFQPPRR
jgi:hypothetical protein